MATSVTTSLPAWLSGCTYDGNGGNDLRNSTITPHWFDPGIVTGSAIGVRGGVIGGAGLVVGPGGGMTVTVKAGSFVVPVTSSPTSGSYESTLTSIATLTVQTADPANPRIDIIVASVTDNGNNTSSGQVQIITGTPAASPSPPAAPANSITLGQVLVPAGSSSVTSGNITDTRPFTCSAGGILVAPKGSVTGYPGQLAYDRTAGWFYHNNNQSGGAQQAKFLPFAPVTVATSIDWSYPNASGGLQTITGLSCNITTDGSTDLKITYHVGSVSGWNGGTPVLQHAITIDGTVIDLTDIMLQQNNGQQGGFTGVAWTSSVVGNTPSAGTHTVAFKADTDSGAGGFPKIHLITGTPSSAWMRVEPVNL
jgi:hypothetical protein